MAGGILYYTKHWASGDMWLMAVACALLGPAFPNFWPDFFIYAVVWSGVLGVVYFLFYFIRAKLYKDYAYLVALNLIMVVYSIFYPYMGLICLSISFLLLLLFSRKKVEDLFVVEKKVRELEEDDWLIEDLKVGKHIIKASKPVGKKEVRLAQKYGKGKVRIKSGVPMTPAFSLALITLLISSL